MLNAQNIQAHVICLRRKPVPEERVVKWKSVFPNLYIFEAIEGKTLDLQNDKRIHILSRMYIESTNSVSNDSIFSVPTVGAIGCFLSHLSLMHHCVEINQPIIIIEQDAEFTDQCCSILPQVLQQIPEDAHYVSLMYISQQHTRPYNHRFRRLVGPQCDGNQCYYISPVGAAMIIKHALPIATQFDLLIGIVSHVEPNFIGYVLDIRLYSIWKVLKDNMDSSIQQFAVKKYLPRSNIFYYAVIFILIILLLYAMHTIA